MKPGRLKTTDNERIKVIRFSKNFGKEVALKAGIDYSKGDIAVLIDCDFQHPVRLIDEFIEHWANGFDMTYGIQKNRDSGTLHR